MPQYVDTKPKIGGAIGNALKEGVNAYQLGRQVNWKNPNREPGSIDLLDLFKDFATKQYQTDQFMNLIPNTTGVPRPQSDPNAAMRNVFQIVQQLRQLRQNQNNPNFIQSMQPNVQMPSPTGGTSQFLNQQQMQQQSTPAPVSRSGMTMQQLVDYGRQQGWVQ